jgi:hypothetical protein
LKNKRISSFLLVMLSLLLAQPLTQAEARSTFRERLQQLRQNDKQEKSSAFKQQSVPRRKDAVFSIEGDPMHLPEQVPLETLRERAMEHRVVSDPNLKIISDRLMTQAQIWHIPENYDQVTIFGQPDTLKSQAVALLEMYNPRLPIKATPEEIVGLYYDEASREGIRWDIAFCQALLETGFFTFGGTVVPEQNNFCGLGTTSATVRGAYFSTPAQGVRAHIQHLMAYTTPRLPQTSIIDPRYDMVHRIKSQSGYATRWSELNGKWAAGSYYAEKIMNIHEQMKRIISFNAEK